jgi:hypothetical protein
MTAEATCRVIAEVRAEPAGYRGVGPLVKCRCSLPRQQDIPDPAGHLMERPENGSAVRGDHRASGCQPTHENRRQSRSPDSRLQILCFAMKSRKPLSGWRVCFAQGLHPLRLTGEAATERQTRQARCP